MTASKVGQYLRGRLDRVYYLMRTGRRHKEVDFGEAMYMAEELASGAMARHPSQYDLRDPIVRGHEPQHGVSPNRPFLLMGHP